VANLIFDQAERKPLSEELRSRLAGRAAVLRLAGLTPYFGSLERDPVHPSTYYLAVDGAEGQPLLLHMVLATAPTSSLFSKPWLVGRMPRHNGREMVINCLPFGPADRESIEKFAAIEPRFLPRPQGPRAAIVVGGSVGLGAAGGLGTPAGGFGDPARAGANAGCGAQAGSGANAGDGAQTDSGAPAGAGASAESGAQAGSGVHAAPGAPADSGAAAECGAQAGSVHAAPGAPADAMQRTQPIIKPVKTARKRFRVGEIAAGGRPAEVDGS